MVKRVSRIICLALIFSLLSVQPASAATTQMYCEDCSRVTNWDTLTLTDDSYSNYYCDKCQKETEFLRTVTVTGYRCGCGNFRSSYDGAEMMCTVCRHLIIFW